MTSSLPATAASADGSSPAIRLAGSGEMQGGRSFLTGLRRGLRRRCPACGEGPLFAGYLAVEPRCPSCAHHNGRYRPDDGPAYFTILIVGHVVIGPLFALSIAGSWSPFLLLALGLPLVAGATLAGLPFIKGGWIGVLWASSRQADEGATEGVGDADA